MDLLIITPPAFDDPALKAALETAGCALIIEDDMLRASALLEKNAGIATLDLTEALPLLTFAQQSHRLSAPIKADELLAKLGLATPSLGISPAATAPAPLSSHEKSHIAFMREALHLAFAQLEQKGGLPFGAVIVKNNHIIGTGHTTVFSHYDPFGRAELNAMRAACQKLKTPLLTGATLYTVAEPDALVLAALYAADINRYYYAATLDDYAQLGFRGRDHLDEMRTPPDKRRIQSHLLMRDEALIALHAWGEWPDKTAF
jgi:tRNA(Arg) A34 adenosine deaminase TadA